jgi:hypothetical protein
MDVCWLIGSGGMLIVTALLCRSRLDLLHEQLGKGNDAAVISQLRDASENTLIPPLVFGGGLAVVLAVNAVAVLFIVRRIKSEARSASGLELA